MLRELFIENLAIIEQARIEFGPGLNVLTGETGAGKSLLVSALELVLGERARVEWIRAGAESARVEALFEPDADTGLAETLEAADYPVEPSLVLKRTVTRSGRSRVYVNDRPTTLGFLDGIGRRIVDIHGQHEHQSLLRRRVQRTLLDVSGGLTPLRGEVAEHCRTLRTLRDRRDQREEEHRRMLAERDLAIFQHDELSRARLRAGEEEACEQERNRLLHVEKLREVCNEADRALQGDRGSVLDTMGLLQRRIEEAARLDPELSPHAGLLETAQHYLEEAVQGLQKYASQLEGDPARLDQLEERLALLHRLRRKYARSEEELIALHTELQARIEGLDRFEEDRETLAQEIQAEEAALLRLAGDLSAGRKKSGRALRDAVEEELRRVGMRETGFRVEVRPLGNEGGAGTQEGVDVASTRIDTSGMDRVEFLIRPNPGQPYKPLRRIASGGELSRIMLALRNVLRHSGSVATLVFDEVDAGIGGAEAEAVGARLKALSRHYQVLCITHLPQIAVFGDTHAKVSKHLEKRSTHFRIERLEGDGREGEIARMLGGARITDKTRAHAQEMLQRAAEKDPA